MNESKLRLDTTLGFMMFGFTRIFTVNGPIYFVTVVGRNHRSVFHMENREGKWRIITRPEPAEWIIDYEEALAHFIERNDNR
jgi:hypothetical protein